MYGYLVFAGREYYPSGGWNDYVGSFSTKDEALACLKGEFQTGSEWGQIVDTSIEGFEVYYPDHFR